MFSKIIQIIIMLNCIIYSVGFWPPEYKVDLHQGETFVIADGFDDNYDEDEMIKPKDIKEFHLEQNDDKFFRLHQLAKRKNERKYVNPFIKKSNKTKKDAEESQYGSLEPAYAGFFDENGILEDSKNVYYANERVKQSVDNLVRKKRVELNLREKRKEKVLDYNYEALKAEYDDQAEKLKAQNDTVKYVEVKEDENVKEAIKNVVNFEKLPKNCTKEEENGIGLSAAECFFADINKTQTKEDKINLARKMGKLMLIWFFVYVTIAIPCWCQRGWCCCCFRCRFCFPRKRINEAKTFMMNNPPGIFHENGKRVAYIPTQYEKYAQKRLEQAIMKL